MRGYSGFALDRAKALRRELTEAEKRLWKLLRSRQLSGAKFRRQHSIGPFIVDFFCPSAHLVVEADGAQHADSSSDRRRDEWLRSRGYRVLRFWNHDILGNSEGVVSAIAAAPSTPHPAQAAPESPSPSRGEGTGE